MMWAVLLPIFGGQAMADQVPQPDVRGIVAAVKEATFTTDLNAPVERITFREGEGFIAGELLIAFDCRRQFAELASLKAHKREMDVALEGNLFLQRRGAAGKRDLETSRARTERAAFDAKALEVRLERCKITAPFPGRVRALHINEHEIPAAGRPLLEIVGTGEIELRLIVPSTWLSWLKTDAPFKFAIDETNKSYDARVKRIGAAVDPVSQTVNVTGHLLAPAPEIRPGMSGGAHFSRIGGRPPG